MLLSFLLFQRAGLSLTIFLFNYRNGLLQNNTLYFIKRTPEASACSKMTVFLFLYQSGFIPSSLLRASLKTRRAASVLPLSRFSRPVG